MSDSPDFDPMKELSKLGIQNIPEEVPPEQIFGERVAVDEPLELTKEAPPERVLGTNPKDAMGAKKPPLSVVPPAGMLYLGAAMGEGARKYGPFNWRENKVQATIYVEAMMRHCLQYLDGEDIDPESGCPHLGHIMASAAILADATETGNLIDDRPLPGAAGSMIRRWTPESKFHG